MLPPVLTDRNLDFDDELWDEGDKIYSDWKPRLLRTENLRAIAYLIDKYRGGVPDELKGPQKGAFNAWARLIYEDGGSAIIRIPIPGKVVFPEEKTRLEVEVMRFLTNKTSIPVPFVLHVGDAEECPDHLGPFMIMEFIEHNHDLCDALNTPSIPYQDRPILDPAITEERLFDAYSQMAGIMLQLYKHAFDKIGSIVYNEDKDTWAVTHRPLTLNMNELVQLGNVSRESLPQTTFETSTSYYVALANMHLAHLIALRDRGMTPTDFKHKFLARCLFRNLARDGKFCRYGDRGPFRLFNDDFRPANVMANDKFQVTGALDWEFTYAAPPEFAFSAPYWLLLELPDYWSNGLDEWTSIYERRFPTFMRALETQEMIAIERGTLKENERLSPFIQDSWETGDFWITYAARRSWAFDTIYWAKIDRRFYGLGNIDDRLRLLTADESEELSQHLLHMKQSRTEAVVKAPSDSTEILS